MIQDILSVCTTHSINMCRQMTLFKGFLTALATRLPPISWVDFQQDESWRLESSRVKSPTFSTLSHIISLVYFTLSLSPLDFQRVKSTFTKTSSNDSSQVESSRWLFLRYPISLVYFTLIKSLATRLPVTRVDTYYRWVNSMRLY